MRKHLTAVLLGSGAAALALGIGTATAMATTATTFTVKPGGAVTGAAGKTILKDTKTGTVLTCNRQRPRPPSRRAAGCPARPRQDHVGHIQHVHRPGVA